MNYQNEVKGWMIACFGEQITADKEERVWRFLEEALELAQAAGCTHEQAAKLLEYVYRRPVGETYQEVGGVMVTLAGLCTANSIEMESAGDHELSRCWVKSETIREKQKAKAERGIGKGDPRP